MKPVYRISEDVFIAPDNDFQEFVVSQKHEIAGDIISFDEYEEIERIYPYLYYDEETSTVYYLNKQRECIAKSDVIDIYDNFAVGESGIYINRDGYVAYADFKTDAQLFLTKYYPGITRPELFDRVVESIEADEINFDEKYVVIDGVKYYIDPH